MKKTILIISLITLISGCASIDYNQMSKGSGISEIVLQQNCEHITCSYDKLKDRVQASSNDMNVLLGLSGSETRTIQFTWVNGSNQISVDLFHITLYGSWSFIKNAEIYVGKEMVAKVDGRVDRRVGYYNDVAREHENIEQVSGLISIAAAEKIANANYEDVTIRFYGKGGYQDVELPRKHDLIYVVNLAKSA